MHAHGLTSLPCLTSDAFLRTTLLSDSGTSGGSSALHRLTLSSGSALGSGGCSPGVASASAASKDGEKKSNRDEGSTLLLLLRGGRAFLAPGLAGCCALP